MNFKFPTMVPTSLRSLIPSASEDGVRLMADMLLWDPQKRPTSAQVRGRMGGGRERERGGTEGKE